MASGEVVQVSISQGGVRKFAIPEGNLTILGLEGDSHAHPEVHGGPLQAVLWITSEGIEELAGLGFRLAYGSLGENLTSRGIDRREWRAGQHWRIGTEVVIEITKPRAPCQSLSIYGPGIQAAVYDALVQDGDPSSSKWGLGGFYASVVQPGTIRPGDEIAFAG